MMMIIIIIIIICFFFFLFLFFKFKSQMPQKKEKDSVIKWRRMFVDSVILRVVKNLDSRQRRKAKKQAPSTKLVGEGIFFFFIIIIIIISFIIWETGNYKTKIHAIDSVRS